MISPGLPVVDPLGATLKTAALERGAAVSPKTDDRIRTTAQDFEALLLSQLLKGLRRTVPVSDDVSPARQIYEELFDEQVAVELARRGGIGLADVITSYLERSGMGKPGGRS